ncbi:MAG TPA: hypothetical protein VN939_16735 [Chthoniobacterales bacterium]|jgi:hypothetical protein|nr:hypothetical protein [Chthoniobacterales bacterium]
MKYRIRPAVTDDSAQLVILLGELGYPSTADFILEKLTQLSSTPGTKILVADREGKVLGLLCFSIVPLLHVSGGLVSGPINNMAFAVGQLAVFQGANDEHI